MSIKQKLMSRKLWACIAGILIGIATIFGLDSNVINTISGAMVAIVSVVTYITTEGKIDAVAQKKIADAAQKTQDAIDIIKDSTEVKEETK